MRGSTLAVRRARAPAVRLCERVRGKARAGAGQRRRRGSLCHPERRSTVKGATRRAGEGSGARHGGRRPRCDQRPAHVGDNFELEPVVKEGSGGRKTVVQAQQNGVGAQEGEVGKEKVAVAPRRAKHLNEAAGDAGAKRAQRVPTQRLCLEVPRVQQPEEAFEQGADPEVGEPPLQRAPVRARVQPQQCVPKQRPGANVARVRGRVVAHNGGGAHGEGAARK